MKNEDLKTVGLIPRKPGANVGKPRKIPASSQMSKYAFGPVGSGGLGGLGGLGGVGSGGNNSVLQGGGGNFYSPELSTDFLELGQSLDELRQYYRFFYNNEPFVHQAIDIHTEIPLSKVRLGIPKARNVELARRSKRFCEKWVKRVNLLQRLIEIVHEYNKIGEVFIWCEDDNPDEPDDLRYEIVGAMDRNGNPIKDRNGNLVAIKKERPDADQRAEDWVNKNYKGWTRITILPPEQVHMEVFSFTDEMIMQLIIDSKTKDVIQRAINGDKAAITVAESLPEEIRNAAVGDSKVNLNTDPYAGSFISYLSRKRSPYEPRGHSLLQSVLRILVYRDKLRQAQTSIASRHMTPIRLVWVEGGDMGDVDGLREQIDFAMADPDYTIVTNFEIHWEEMPSNGRLLDISGEYELTDRQMYAGLGVTESLLSGESSYSGDRINLEVINTRYLLLREMLQNLVEEKIFKPMCYRMGFVEIDEDGDESVIYPSLSFSRLGIRDNDSTFDHLFNLYQKGSLDIWSIYDLLNLDGQAVYERIMGDLLTVNDPTFNEAMRALYSRVGDQLMEQTNAFDKITRHLKLRPKKSEESDSGSGGGGDMDFDVGGMGGMGGMGDVGGDIGGMDDVGDLGDVGDVGDLGSAGGDFDIGGDMDTGGEE